MVNRVKAPSPQRSLSPAIPLLWLGLAVWGTLAMMSQSNQPGPAGAAPAQWPSASKLPRPAQKPALIMFVHSTCACSAASLSELSVLMSHCPGSVNTHVLFLSPDGRPADWAQSALWRAAAAIPGIGLAPDTDGSEARCFGAETSGDVVLYGADGRLRFQGGLTLSRGTSWDNPGRAALQALIDHQPSQVTQTPVFGCRLSGSKLAAQK
jgi:hypothetical protein